MRRSRSGASAAAIGAGRVSRADDVAVRRPAPRRAGRGIVGFSGRRLAPELLTGELAPPAHPLGPRPRTPSGSVQLAGRGGDYAQGGRCAGEDGNLGRHRPLDRRPRIAGRGRASFSKKCSAGRRLDHAVAGEEGFEDVEDLGVIRFGAPSTRPRTSPSRSIRKLVGKPRAPKACPTRSSGSI